MDTRIMKIYSEHLDKQMGELKDLILQHKNSEAKGKLNEILELEYLIKWKRSLCRVTTIDVPFNELAGIIKIYDEQWGNFL